MCGRFGLFAELDALAEQFNFDLSIMQDIYSPRWNIKLPGASFRCHATGTLLGSISAKLRRPAQTSGPVSEHPLPRMR